VIASRRRYGMVGRAGVLGLTMLLGVPAAIFYASPPASATSAWSIEPSPDQSPTRNLAAFVTAGGAVTTPGGTSAVVTADQFTYT
jgi:hypothetical protein